MVKQRILVVDDDRDFADVIARRCRGIGFDADTASTPLSAVVSMHSHPPDLVCIDVHMPTCNGLDLCEYLLPQSNASPTPVIIVTGQTDGAANRRATLMGVVIVYKAPGMWQALQPLIEGILCRRRETPPVVEARPVDLKASLDVAVSPALPQSTG